jgi:hypothetical protein
MADDEGFMHAIDTVLRTFDREALPAAQYQQLQFALYNTLTMIWNTRGAADIAALEHVFAGSAAAGVMSNADRALRKLDR